MSCLSDKGILRCMSEGKISIEPFIKENLNTSSYDVTLGPTYYRQNKPIGVSVYNIYSKEMVETIWRKEEAETYEHWYKTSKCPVKLENIAQDDKIIWIGPGETILAHTNEVIGGRDTVTTMMKARSSLGRSFIEVCKW
jgi:dCTP deaminase